MVIVGNRYLELNDFFQSVFEGEKVELSGKAMAKVEKSFTFLQEFSKDKLIYGINTGFGPMSDVKIADSDRIAMQYNLIRSHASGSGAYLSKECSKSAFLARLNSLIRGSSAVHPELIWLMAEFLSRDIVPALREHGGVGASGDLVQLAHIALALIGEGEVYYKGEIRPTAEVFRGSGLKPLKIYLREGLALLNGTSAMTGIGIVNAILVRNLFDWAYRAACLIMEITESFDDHISAELNNVKLHRGQRNTAEMMRQTLSDSKLIRKRPEMLYNGSNGNGFHGKVQEFYSIRCVPQILGPVYDAIVSAEKTLMDEANSASDNPITDYETENVLHGGNFHGDYVSFEMDKLKIAVVKMSMLLERQLNFLLNDKLNRKLPPFLNLGKLGVNLGLQGMQYTATSTTAENQSCAFPMYVHSIPNNNDNQDIVSMGANSALMCRKVILNSYEVLAVELIALAQAVDFLKIKDKLASPTYKVYMEIREIVPPIIEDKPHYEELEKVRNFTLKINNYKPLS